MYEALRIFASQIVPKSFETSGGGGILLGGVGYDWEGILGALRSANRRLSGEMASSWRALPTGGFADPRCGSAQAVCMRHTV
jgi:hypothetical protein